MEVPSAHVHFLRGFSSFFSLAFTKKSCKVNLGNELGYKVRIRRIREFSGQRCVLVPNIEQYWNQAQHFILHESKIIKITAGSSFCCKRWFMRCYNQISILIQTIESYIWTTYLSSDIFYPQLIFAWRIRVIYVLQKSEEILENKQNVNKIKKIRYGR